MIYFDNAATTLIKPDKVKEAVINSFNTISNNGRGNSTVALNTNRTIFQCRENIASFFGIKNSSQLAFTSNSTEALNIAIKGIFKKGEHIITTSFEHNSVLRPLYEMEKKGLELSIIWGDKDCNFPYTEIEKYIKKNTKAIICTHSSNLTGDILDIDYISKICKKYNLIFIVDASQTAGIIPIDVEKNGIDVLCFTGHKSLFAMQGIGGIYVREGIEITPLKSGGTGILTFSKTQPKNMPELLEAGTLNGMGIISLNAGIEFINEIGIENIRDKEIALMQRFYNGIKDLKNIKIYGDFSKKYRTPIVTFNMGDYSSDDVGEELNRSYDIVCRTGGHCAPLAHQMLGTTKQGAIRFSFSYFNTQDEIDTAIDTVKKLTLSL